LKSWRRALVAERLAWGEAWTDTGRVFSREDGKPLRPSFVTVRFQRLAFDAGLPPIPEHDPRHGAASLARKGGVDMKCIQAISVTRRRRSQRTPTRRSSTRSPAKPLKRSRPWCLGRSLSERRPKLTFPARSPQAIPKGLRSIT